VTRRNNVFCGGSSVKISSTLWPSHSLKMVKDNKKISCRSINVWLQDNRSIIIKHVSLPGVKTKSRGYVLVRICNVRIGSCVVNLMNHLMYFKSIRLQQRNSRTRSCSISICNMYLPPGMVCQVSACGFGY